MAPTQVVFGVCAAGAVVLTINVVLLGGNIGFFQSLCLLGYCLFPLDVAAIVATFVKNHIVRCAMCSCSRRQGVPKTTPSMGLNLLACLAAADAAWHAAMPSSIYFCVQCV